jgi:hypothetical protein
VCVGRAPWVRQAGRQAGRQAAGISQGGDKPAWLHVSSRAHGVAGVCCCDVRRRAPLPAAVEWPTIPEMLDACAKGLQLEAQFEVRAGGHLLRVLACAPPRRNCSCRAELVPMSRCSHTRALAAAGATRHAATHPHMPATAEALPAQLVRGAGARGVLWPHPRQAV